MGLFDFLKDKKAAEPAKPQATVSPAAPAPKATGTPFDVKFGDKMLYQDPEYDLVEIAFNGIVAVAHPDRSGSESDIQFARTIVLATVKETLDKAGKETKVPVKDLPSYAGRLKQEVTKQLKEKGFEVNRIGINSITLTENGREIVALKDRQKMVQSMSPEDIAKKMGEAQKQAPAMSAAPKFCSSCGAPVAGSKFCSNCGAPVQ